MNWSALQLSIEVISVYYNCREILTLLENKPQTEHPEINRLYKRIQKGRASFREYDQQQGEGKSEAIIQHSAAALPALLEKVDKLIIELRAKGDCRQSNRGRNHPGNQS